MFNLKAESLAKTLLQRPGARLRVFRPDGTVDRAALALELKSAEFAASSANSETPFRPVDTWNEKQGGKGFRGLKQAKPGRQSGHRPTRCGWKGEGL